MPFGFLKFVYLTLCNLDFIYCNRKKNAASSSWSLFETKIIPSKEIFLSELSNRAKGQSCLYAGAEFSDPADPLCLMFLMWLRSFFFSTLRKRETKNFYFWQQGL